MAREHSYLYDVFMSYSHVDDTAARDIQRGIESFGSSILGRRSLRVFRDNTSLPLTSDLWAEIAESVSSSKFFLLLASPDSARSPWVAKELDYFLRDHSLRKVGIILLRGTYPWNLQPSNTPGEAAISKESIKLFAGSVPYIIDLTGHTQSNGRLDTKTVGFLSKMASVVSAATGVPKDTIFSEHLQVARRRSLAILFSLLVFVALSCLSLGLWQASERSLRLANSRLDYAIGTAEKIQALLSDANEDDKTSRLHTEVVRLLKGIRRDAPDNYTVAYGEALALLRNGEAAEGEGQHEEAEAAYGLAFLGFAELVINSPEDNSLADKANDALTGMVRNSLRNQNLRAALKNILIGRLLIQRQIELNSTGDTELLTFRMANLLMSSAEAWQLAGDTTRAKYDLIYSAQLMAPLSKIHSGNLRYTNIYFAICLKLGALSLSTGELKEAAETARLAETLLQKLYKLGAAEHFQVEREIDLRELRGRILAREGKVSDAKEEFMAALALNINTARNSGFSPRAVSALAKSLSNLSDLDQEPKDSIIDSRIVTAIDEATKDLEQSGLLDDGEALSSDVASIFIDTAQLMLSGGRSEAAVSHLRRGVRILTVMGDKHFRTPAETHDLLHARLRVADILDDTGASEDALAEYDGARSLASGLLANDPKNHLYIRDCGVISARIAEVQVDLSELELAVDEYRRSISYFEAMREKDPSNLANSRDILISRMGLIDAYKAMRRQQLAEFEFDIAARELRAIEDTGMFAGDAKLEEIRSILAANRGRD